MKSASNSEKPKVTNAFDTKLTRTMMLNPFPLSREGRTSKIINQQMRPKDNCKIEINLHENINS